MAPKASAATKKASAATKSPATGRKKASQPKAKAGARKAKSSWSEVMKRALEKKQPPGGFPEQPKPRDSVVQKVRKNAY
jgi:hypothetical protein